MGSRAAKGRCPMRIPADEPRAIALAEEIRVGDVEALERLLDEHEELATARFVDPACGDERTALHVLTDWPGHTPSARAMVAALVAAGAGGAAPLGGAPPGRAPPLAAPHARAAGPHRLGA